LVCIQSSWWWVNLYIAIVQNLGSTIKLIRVRMTPLKNINF